MGCCRLLEAADHDAILIRLQAVCVCDPLASAAVPHHWARVLGSGRSFSACRWVVWCQGVALAITGISVSTSCGPGHDWCSVRSLTRTHIAWCTRRRPQTWLTATLLLRSSTCETCTFGVHVVPEHIENTLSNRKIGESSWSCTRISHSVCTTKIGNSRL